MKKPVLVVLVLALALAACSSSSGASGDTLRIGTTFTCNSMNPFASFGQTCAMLFRYNYPYLLQYDRSTDEVVGDFATEWQAGQDGLTTTFELRDGTQWSDGKPLTADDVAFTINTIVKFAEGATAGEASSVRNIASAEAAGPTRLTVHYAKPLANALGNLVRLPILPKHVWESHAGGDGAGLKTFANAAPLVSGGPYQLTEYTKGQIALMKPNDRWYGAAPKLPSFGLQFFASPDAMVTALKDNQIDYVAPLPVTSAKAVTEGGFTVTRNPGLRFHDLIINSNTKVAEHRELLDPRVRQAFGQAVDRQKIIDTAYLGYGTPGSTIIPPSTGDWHNSGIKPETFDLNAANTLLDQAGYAKGADGVRVANGQRMSYEVVIPDVEGGEGERALEIVRQDFTKIGVELTPKRTDNSTAFSEITGPDNTYDTFTMAQWGFIAQQDPDFMLAAMRCDQWGAFNDSGYCDPAYDALYDQQASTMDPVQRKQLVWRMQQMIFDAKPYIITHYDDLVEAHSARWQGFPTSAQGVLDSQARPLLAVSKG